MGRLLPDAAFVHGLVSSAEPVDPVIGRQTSMATQPDGTGKFLVQNTQLISARNLSARQWVVTLRQVSRTDSQATPWAMSWDNGNTFFPAGGMFTAPIVPEQMTLRCMLRWGAGGVAFATQFDYPIAGGVFGVTADELDLNVMVNGNTAFAAGEVPVIGAFAVPGIAADPTPLQWTEVGQAGLAGTAPGPAGSVFWSVKPYAKRVRIVSSNATTKLVVKWWDAGGNPAITGNAPIVPTADGGCDVEFDVPSKAAILEVDNGGAGACDVTAVWEIGLT